MLRFRQKINSQIWETVGEFFQFRLRFLNDFQELDDWDAFSKAANAELDETLYREIDWLTYLD